MANSKDSKHHHHILSTRTTLTVGLSLLFLTVVTVWVASIDLGPLNFAVAMFVATIKASLVASIFMNLWFDRKENAVMFVTSFLFLAIFIVFTSTDLFFRGDVYHREPIAAGAAQKSTLKNPWVPTPAIVARGKELFAQQCVSCHGPNGQGDGPAAAALNPHPRNFTSGEGWKNGRNPAQVFQTLTKGIPGTGMGSFATLGPDDRWSLAHYVLSLGPTPPQATEADLAKAGIDLKGGSETKTIPIERAMSLLAQAEPPAREVRGGAPGGAGAGAGVYRAQCASCHGEQGEGAVIRGLGIQAKLRTEPFSASSAEVASADRFNQVVTQGIPGSVMPGNAQLSRSQVQELHQYVKSIAGR